MVGFALHFNQVIGKKRSQRTGLNGKRIMLWFSYCTFQLYMLTLTVPNWPPVYFKKGWGAEGIDNSNSYFPTRTIMGRFLDSSTNVYFSIIRMKSHSIFAAVPTTYYINSPLRETKVSNELSILLLSPPPDSVSTMSLVLSKWWLLASANCPWPLSQTWFSWRPLQHLTLRPPSLNPFSALCLHSLSSLIPNLAVRSLSLWVAPLFSC